MHNLTNLADVGLDAFLAPARTTKFAAAFPKLWWWPVTLVLVATFAFWAWYFHTIDINWLLDVGMKQALGSMPPEMLEKARQFLTPGVLMAQAMFGAVIMLGFRLASVATYLHLIAKLAHDNTVSFMKWLSLAAWSTLPELLSTLAMAASYATAGDRELDPDQLVVTSIGPTLGLHPAGPAGVLLGYDLVGLWSLYILIVGVAQFRSISRQRASLIVLVPWALLLVVRLALSTLK
jgi:hypothetical protein